MAQFKKPQTTLAALCYLQKLCGGVWKGVECCFLQWINSVCLPLVAVHQRTTAPTRAWGKDVQWVASFMYSFIQLGPTLSLSSFSIYQSAEQMRSVSPALLQRSSSRTGTYTNHTVDFRTREVVNDTHVRFVNTGVRKYLFWNILWFHCTIMYRYYKVLY